MATKYTCATIFNKKGNLNDYLHTDKVLSRFTNHSPSAATQEFYGRESEIELILLTRIEPADGPYPQKVFCKIKCPVSPLPVRGEFEAPCYAAIYQFLHKNGWTFKQKIYSRIFE